MTRYVALLRGINVSGRRVKMDRLRAIFAALGFTDVSTFIASGNVIFSSGATGDRNAVAREIERGLAEALGYAVATFLRTPDELASVAAFHPRGHSEGRALYVIFLNAAADQAVRASLAELESEANRFSFGDREIYWSMQGTFGESPLSVAVAKATGDAETTMRSATSLVKLVARLEAG